MKKIVFILCALIPLFSSGKIKVSTPSLRFDMDAAAMPSNIDYIDGSLQFVDADNDNTIGADEQCYIQFKITNSGNGNGHGCEARISVSGTKDGIICKPTRFPRVNKGDTVLISYPIQTNHYTKNGKAKFAMEIYEPNGFGTGDIFLEVATHQFDAPKVELGEYVLASDKTELQRKEKFAIQIPVQNLAQGIAENVKVAITCPSGITLLNNDPVIEIGRLKPNESRVITFELIPTVNAPESLPFKIKASEKYGMYGTTQDIELQLGRRISIASTISSTRAADVELKRFSLISDVDKDIPVSNTKNKNTFVVIIANEKYETVESVPFAINDGKSFRQYCELTLGIPAKNIHDVINATGNQIKTQINWLQTVIEVFDNPNIIFYYAGHGIPDEKSRTAYLLPVDGVLSDLSTCYKLDDLYTTLGEMPVGRISVFMDACFSGSKRENGMLVSARGVALKARPGMPQGNMVVFSAAQGDETAYPYTEQQHGMFTYYLLKKLQETRGDVTLLELGDYITAEVKKQSVLENNKLQTPSVTPSAVIGTDWQTWKLK